jgi:hypothetical protein
MKIFILIMASFALLINTDKTNSQLVKFEYSGPSDRYIPAILFYVDKYTKSDAPILGPYKLSQKEMKSLIQYILKDDKLISKKVDANFYTVSISNGNKFDTLFIADRQKLKEVFKNVLPILENSKMKKKVNSSFEYLLRR